MARSSNSKSSTGRHPTEQEILECQTDCQILKILESVDRDMEVSKGHSERQLVIAGTQCYKVSTYKTLGDFMDLLVRDSGNIVGPPSHPNNFSMTLSCEGSELKKPFSQDVGVDNELAVASKLSNSHKLVVERFRIQDEVFPDDFTVSDWLFDMLHYTPVLHDEAAHPEGQRWHIAFESHAEVVLGLIARATERDGHERNNWSCEYWYHKTQDYITVACLSK